MTDELDLTTGGDIDEVEEHAGEVDDIDPAKIEGVFDEEVDAEDVFEAPNAQEDPFGFGQFGEVDEDGEFIQPEEPEEEPEEEINPDLL